MTRHFDYLKITRNNLLKATESLTTEQLNTIPKGFNNNIIWNMAHSLVTQYLLCYGLSGAPMPIVPEYIDRFRKGTRPEGPLTSEEIAFFRHLLAQAPIQMEQDYASGLFPGFKDDYTTSFGVTLQSTKDAIRFNNIHEGLHLGYVMALKKCLL
jgi:DinB superfamily